MPPRWLRRCRAPRGALPKPPIASPTRHIPHPEGRRVVTRQRIRRRVTAPVRRREATTRGTAVRRHPQHLRQHRQHPHPQVAIASLHDAPAERRYKYTADEDLASDSAREHAEDREPRTTAETKTTTARDDNEEPERMRTKTTTTTPTPTTTTDRTTMTTTDAPLDERRPQLDAMLEADTYERTDLDQPTTKFLADRNRQHPPQKLACPASPGSDMEYVQTDHITMPTVESARAGGRPRFPREEYFDENIIIRHEEEKPEQRRAARRKERLRDDQDHPPMDDRRRRRNVRRSTHETDGCADERRAAPTVDGNRRRRRRHTNVQLNKPPTLPRREHLGADGSRWTPPRSRAAFCRCPPKNTKLTPDLHPNAQATTYHTQANSVPTHHSPIPTHSRRRTSREQRCRPKPRRTNTRERKNTKPPTNDEGPRPPRSADDGDDAPTPNSHSHHRDNSEGTTTTTDKAGGHHDIQPHRDHTTTRHPHPNRHPPRQHAEPHRDTPHLSAQTTPTRPQAKRDPATTTLAHRCAEPGPTTSHPTHTQARPRTHTNDHTQPSQPGHGTHRENAVPTSTRCSPRWTGRATGARQDYRRLQPPSTRQQRHE